MSNYKSDWANSALRPTLFGVLDSFAVVPLVVLVFDLSNRNLYIFALVTIVTLTVLRYIGFTPSGVYLSIRRIIGRFLMGRQRGDRVPFLRSIKKLLP